MKKNKNKNINYLDKIPVKPEKLGYSKDENDIVSLEIENKGYMNRIFQKFFKKPPVTYIHLDELGSFVWLNTDGEKTVMEISEIVKEHFGEKAEPLYERLVKYFQILESYHFIDWK